jgi:hypothetical protein
MYFTVEDVQPAVDVVTATLGQQGIMLEGKNVTKNVLLGSPQFGKLWYGDIDGDMEYINSICHILSQRTGQRISVVTDSF